MIKTLRNLFKQDKERFVVPKSVQDVIPAKAIYEDGIFLVGGKYAKSYKFEDINYAVASREDKEAMFLEYSELLNSLDSGATTKITINNRRLNKADFEQSILIPRAVFNSERRYYEKLQDTGTYLDTIAESTSQTEIKSVEDFLNSVEDERLYQELLSVDKLTLQAVVLKIQGYSTREIASLLDLTEKSIYRRMDRLKEKLKTFNS